MKKLSLRTRTIRNLSARDLANVNGGILTVESTIPSCGATCTDGCSASCPPTGGAVKFPK